jgi:hypothetical protein
VVWSSAVVDVLVVMAVVVVMVLVKLRTWTNHLVVLNMRDPVFSSHVRTPSLGRQPLLLRWLPLLRVHGCHC